MHLFTLVLLSTIALVHSLPLKYRHLARNEDANVYLNIARRNDTPSSTTSITSALVATVSTSASSSAVPTSSTSPLPPSVPAALNSSQPSQKLVVAHHIVGNTFPYNISDWASDIALAHSVGIDAFALNVGSDDWQPARVADAYEAAAQSNTSFKLFISFDMSSLPCSSASDAQLLRTYISNYSTHPSQLLYSSTPSQQPRVFASTFSGSACTFGSSSPSSGWTSQFTQHPALTGNSSIFFVPSFFIDPSTFNQFSAVMDGDFNFNSGWPIQVTTSFATSLLSSVSSPSPLFSLTSLSTAPVSSTANRVLTQFVGNTSTDEQHLSALAAMNGTGGKGERIYMAAVSPWFFTHYSPQSFDKNFIYLTDDHLYSTRWQNLVASRDQIDIVEIVTWNDYGESHYIGPIKGAQPPNTSWVTGFDHTGWLALTSYFSQYFKSGSPPAVVRDELVMWARPHPAAADASGDGVGKPSNSELAEDTLWAVVLATAPANVTLSTPPNANTTNPSSSSSNSTAGASQTFAVPAGLTKLSIPLVAGSGMHGSISRGAQTVLDVEGDGYVFDETPVEYNFNAFVVAGST